MDIILTSEEKNTALSFVGGLIDAGIPVERIPTVAQRAVADFFSEKEIELSITELEKNAFRTRLTFAIQLECDALKAQGAS